MTTSKLLLLLLLTALPSDENLEQAPEAVVKTYFADRAARVGLTARFPKLQNRPAPAAANRSDSPQTPPRPGPSIRAGKVIEDCAVVVMYESPTDPDPVYLIKQEGAWRILPKLTRYDRDYFEFPETTLARFRELEKWYRAQVGK